MTNIFIEGYVEKEIYYNKTNGFIVLKVFDNSTRAQFTAVGYSESDIQGKIVKIEGTWVDKKTLGRQFHFKKINSQLPDSDSGMIKYLSSPLFKGIGPSFAKKIVSYFGKETFNIIEKDPLSLNKVEGLGIYRIEKIQESWQKNQKIHKTKLFLLSIGLGYGRIQKIMSTYGVEATKIIKNNPYRLMTDFQNIGFATADKYAEKIGFAEDSSFRISAGIIYILNEAAKEGNCGLKKVDLLDKIKDLLCVPEIKIIATLDDMSHEIVEDTIDNDQFVFLSKLYNAENGIFVSIKRILSTVNNVHNFDIPVMATKFEKESNFSLSQEQKLALKVLLNSKISILTGGPGVGKTTLIRAVTYILDSTGIKTILCAPTGKASRRLAESTSKEAKTIHRLLEFDPIRKKFKFNRDNKLYCGYIIIDESSMIDVMLMSCLLAALPNKVHIIFVGDINQLPSVGPGQVLTDLFLCKEVAHVKLTKIFRQGEDSKIIINSHLINNGKMPDIFSNKNEKKQDFYFISCEDDQEIYIKLKKLVFDRIPKSFGFHSNHDIQILTPMNKGKVGAQALNIFFQKLFSTNKQVPEGHNFFNGDKVIQIVNNYEKNVFNGDVGYIIDIQEANKIVVIKYLDQNVSYSFNELEQIRLAYAISIHKSQGSEYPVVIIPLLMEQFTLLRRNLLYTAITRGKRLVIILGQKKALSFCINNKRQKSRFSKLGDLVKKFVI